MEMVRHTSYRTAREPKSLLREVAASPEVEETYGEARGASGGVLVAQVLAQFLVSILWDIGRDSCFTPIPIETGFGAILVQVRRAIHRPTGLGDWLNPTGSACWRRAGLGGSAGLLVKTSPWWSGYQRDWRATSSRWEGTPRRGGRPPGIACHGRGSDTWWETPMTEKTRQKFVWEVARSPLPSSRLRSWRGNGLAGHGVQEFKGRRCTAQLGERLSVAWTRVRACRPSGDFWLKQFGRGKP